MPEGLMQQVDDFEKKFLTRDEAARLLGLRPQTLANFTWKNEGPPYVRISSRCLRYEREALLSWMKEREVRPGEQED
jgi:predicted DNA-binding transcriptional regulator AlpA